MTKSLKEILDGVKSSKIVPNDLGGYKPKAEGEVKFVAKHKIEKWEDRVGNKDNASNPGYVLEKPDENKHGRTEKESKAVYEENLDEASEKLQDTLKVSSGKMSQADWNEKWRKGSNVAAKAINPMNCNLGNKVMEASEVDESAAPFRAQGHDPSNDVDTLRGIHQRHHDAIMALPKKASYQHYGHLVDKEFNARKKLKKLHNIDVPRPNHGMVIESEQHLDEISDTKKRQYLDKAIDWNHSKWHEPAKPEHITPSGGKLKKSYTDSQEYKNKQTKFSKRRESIQKTAKDVTGNKHFSDMDSEPYNASNSGYKYTKESENHKEICNKTAKGVLCPVHEMMGCVTDKKSLRQIVSKRGD